MLRGAGEVTRFLRRTAVSGAGRESRRPGFASSLEPREEGASGAQSGFLVHLGGLGAALGRAEARPREGQVWAAGGSLRFPGARARQGQRCQVASVRWSHMDGGPGIDGPGNHRSGRLPVTRGQRPPHRPPGQPGVWVGVGSLHCPSRYVNKGKKDVLSEIQRPGLPGVAGVAGAASQVGRDQA